MISLAEKIHSRRPPELRTLYVHIPFCRHLCPFCAFAVRRDNARRHADYLNLLEQEAQLRRPFLENHLAPLDSIYFGGGTPSSLRPEEVQDLLDRLQAVFPFAAEAEVAFELNPEDVTPDYLRALRAAGVTRVSLGGQSFQPAVLQRLGRHHTPEQLHQALQDVRAAGFRSWNLDVMFGIPEQSLADFEADLAAVSLHEPPHLSLYGLEVHEGTPYGASPVITAWHQEQEELAATLYLTAVEHLTRLGWEQYEVSNFARPGHQGRQNLRVWDGEFYLGLGLGAHSFFQGVRWGNVKALHPYQQRLQASSFPEAFQEVLQPNEQANEWLMLALRRPQGLNLEAWAQSVSAQEHLARLQPTLQHWVTSGWASWDPPLLALTPEGLLRADALTAELMLD